MTRSATILALSVLLVFVGGTGASKSAVQATYRAGIYSIRDDGTDRQLIALPEPPVSSLIRSPGGRLILFTRQADRVTALFAAERSGANAVRLTPPELYPVPIEARAYVAPASFSPDGRTVAFTGYRRYPCGFRVCPTLYVVGRDGSDLRIVADGAGSAPSWAPDSRRLAYTRGSLGVYVTDVQSGDTSLVGRGDHPIWAPRGERIAYTAKIGGYASACLANADGSRKRCTRGHSLTWLVWSRNAKHVAFKQANPPLLGIVDADARHFRSLGYHGRAAHPVAWSPDGRRLAYLGGKGVEVLRLAAPARSRPVVDEQYGAVLDDIRWRGRRISYVASRPDGSG
jgi:Tol biopolymer transport system component